MQWPSFTHRNSAFPHRVRNTVVNSRWWAGSGANALVVEAHDILAGLYEDDIIEPGHGQLAAGPLPGTRFTATELPGGEFAMHWPAGLYYNVTSVEREYFDMFFFSNLKSYKGAFHMSPDYAWW
ncbi:MAG: hypothetical protein JSW46_07020 [Gemmatimonadota bacterium]|nr:MAG: hypothetical protein JSW46_07020 [Gemmatimonadota bacterium]